MIHPQDRQAADGGVSAVLEQREAIDACFAEDSVEAIYAALQEQGTEWAAATLDLLRK